jgi:hypothetical protein
MRSSFPLCLCSKWNPAIPSTPLSGQVYPFSAGKLGEIGEGPQNEWAPRGQGLERLAVRRGARHNRDCKAEKGVIIRNNGGDLGEGSAGRWEER